MSKTFDRHAVHSWFAAFAAISVAAGGCIDTDDEKLGTTGEDLYWNTRGDLWTENGNVVPMCWYTNINPVNGDTGTGVNGVNWDAEKQFIIDEVRKSWESVADITVTWEDCPVEGEAQHVRINLTYSPDFSRGATPSYGMANATTPATASMGVEFGFALDGHRTEPTLNWNTNADTLARARYVVIHELGHVLGFEHEQDRPDRVDTRPCNEPNDTGEFVQGFGIMIGPFDQYSIMNYCNDSGSLLDDGDVRGVRSIYGARGAQDTRYTDPALFTTRISNWCQNGILGLGDFNGDGNSDAYCRDPMSGGATRTWVSLSNGAGGFNVSYTPWLTGWCGTPGQTFGVADMDGNGKTDFWCHDAPGGSGRSWVARSSGTGVTGDVWTPWLTSWCGSPGQMLSITDVSGDGKSDFICHDGPGQGGNTWVARSSGTGVTGNIWTQWMTGWCGQGQQFGIADFDHDGKQDFYCKETALGNLGRVWVARSTGTGATGIQSAAWISSWCSDPGQTFGLGDFDGDGRADIYCHDPMNGASSQGRTWVSLSTGSAFAANFSPWIEGWCGQSNASFGVNDFNGDGKSDLWCHDPSYTYTAMSYGSWFGSNDPARDAAHPSIPKLDHWCTNPNAVFTGGEFNNDGNADFLCKDPVGGSGRVWLALTSRFYQAP